MRIDHVTIATADLETTVSFYRDVLGLVSGPRPAFPFARAWLSADGRPIVHLKAPGCRGALRCGARSYRVLHGRFLWFHRAPRPLADQLSGADATRRLDAAMLPPKSEWGAPGDCWTVALILRPGNIWSRHGERGHPTTVLLGQKPTISWKGAEPERRFSQTGRDTTRPQPPENDRIVNGHLFLTCPEISFTGF